MQSIAPVLVTGITGQDGGHLTELLLAKNYEVVGLVQPESPRAGAFSMEFPDVRLVKADLRDDVTLVRVMKHVRPSQVFHLGAASHVGRSFADPRFVTQVVALGTLNLLEAARTAGLEDYTRFFQASTSEMFGGLDYDRPGNGYDESSPFHPRSPYSTAKLHAHWTARNYRESYGMFVATGILFNHEGERRRKEFVTRKITDAVARISLGQQDMLTLGPIWPKRDWGYAGDFVRGMWQILQHDQPEDFVLATGVAHSIEDFLSTAFGEVHISDWRPYVKHDGLFQRPAEVDILLGNPSKAERVLGWRREVAFPELVRRMVRNDLRINS